MTAINLENSKSNLKIVVDSLKDKRLKEKLTNIDKVSQIISLPKYKDNLFKPTPSSIVSFFKQAGNPFASSYGLLGNLPFFMHSEIYLQIISDAKKELSVEFYKEAINLIPSIDSYETLLTALDLLKKASVYGCELANVRINDAIVAFKVSLSKVSFIYKRKK